MTNPSNKMNTKLPSVEKCQSIIFELTDGSIHCFTGRAFTKKNEDRRIVFDSIKFTEPKKLPIDCKWSEHDPYD